MGEEFEVGDRVKVGDLAGTVTYVYDPEQPYVDVQFDGYDLTTDWLPKALNEKLPDPPKVGDTITPKQVRETPWKRGTVLRGNGVKRALLLCSDGVWTRDDGERYEFAKFGTWPGSAYLVELLPAD